ncbi:MAG: sigma-70 family RNA polymerase sigma factor [Planctomycetota bacterium]
MSDETLPAAIASQSDFIRHFIRHEPILRAYARTMLPDWNAVDDALQEASVVMWEKLDQLENPQGFLPWAKVIVRFKCLKIVETLRYQRPLFEQAVIEMIADEAAELIPDDSANRRAALDGCLATFSEMQREMLLAPYHDHGRLQALAIDAGKTPNAIYKMVARLRQKLSECVELRLDGQGA